MTGRLALPLAALALLAAGCGGDDGEEEGAARTEPPAVSASGCRVVEGPAPREQEQREAPTEKLTPGATVRVVVETNCGAFTITLDQRSAPNTAASFAELARDDFYDNTVFHRIVPGFVIQGGDPTATGSGGPGYTTVDKPPTGTRYTKGVVAMAKTAAEAPGTAGSQFFVVTGDATHLPPDYAVIGRVTAGMDVVERIAGLGDPGTEMPTEIVVVEDMRVEGG